MALSSSSGGIDGGFIGEACAASACFGVPGRAFVRPRASKFPIDVWVGEG